jgi:hypothetical protein
MTFKFIHSKSSLSHLKLKEKAEVFLHLNIDNFEPDIMYADNKKPGVYYKVRMVPANLVTFFFSIDNFAQIRSDIDIVDADFVTYPQLRMAEDKGIIIPWKLNKQI